jgi:hypothetical protein
MRREDKRRVPHEIAILDSSFKYTPSSQTDVRRKTFARARLERQAQIGHEEEHAQVLRTAVRRPARRYAAIEPRFGGALSFKESPRQEQHEYDVLRANAADFKHHVDLLTASPGAELAAASLT